MELFHWAVVFLVGSSVLMLQTDSQGEYLLKTSILFSLKALSGEGEQFGI